MFLATAVLTTLLVLVAYWTDVARDAELDTVDARFEVRGDREAPDDVVVVDIDDNTFSELNQQWPFPRSMHADVIRRLSEAGARAIVYDVQFTEPTEPREDNALIEAVDEAGNVVLATTEVLADGGTRVLGGDEVLREIGARAGHANLPNDPGGVIRRLPYEVDGLKSLSVAGAETALGREIESDELGDGTAWIDFAGGPGTVRTVTFARVLGGRALADLIRDRVAVVGASVPSLQDVHPTSVADEALMSGPELQANAVATALADFPLDGSPPWIDVALIVLLGMVGPVAAMRYPAPLALVLTLAVGALFALASQLAFNSGMIVSLVYPMTALVAGVVTALAVQLVVGAFERQRVRDIFARFVPEAVVDEVLADVDEDVRLGGVRREVTVMFTDVRGFTTFSETRQPDEVIDILNRYLSAMTDVIMAHGGTLISYMGDGIMAVFGAPIVQPDHADRAVEAAREMVGSRLEEFNESMAAENGGVAFKMGVGLNTGPVMVGNVGSEQRLEYTAIGDVTNTASRIEGMTKGTPYSIFVADSTREALTRPPDDLVHVAEMPVRGRQVKVGIWSVPDGMDTGALAEARA
jgi:adenylate cyclase